MNDRERTQCFCCHLNQFFLQSIRIRVDLLLYESKMTDQREQYDWIEGKKSGRVASLLCPHREVTELMVFTIKYIITLKQCIIKYTKIPFKFFSALQSYCPRFSVILLSYNSRSTLIRMDCKKNWLRWQQKH